MMREQLTKSHFVAIDGDDVGLRLRDKIIANDIEGVSLLSLRLSEFFQELRSTLEITGLQIIFCGADSILAMGTQEVIKSMFARFPLGPCTVSVGIGDSSENAYLALQLAKARGKNQAVRIEQIVAQTVYDWGSLVGWVDGDNPMLPRDG